MEDELVQLATIYSSPGFLLLASDDEGQPVGCVGLRMLQPSIGPRSGEIRRLFVRDSARATGLGRSLASRLIELALTEKFDRLVLNTLPEMTEAVGLYRALGFGPVDPYVDEPIEDTLYFGLELSP
ncbi:MAG: GNAT superfamily N-acetyltransferase [Acidimicrobiales bacterium]|jgi:GNAT superfamily N-acetyltransferase